MIVALNLRWPIARIQCNAGFNAGGLLIAEPASRHRERGIL
jgi:hypothetical protein